MAKKFLVSLSDTQKEQLIILAKAEEKRMTTILQDGLRMYVANARRQYPNLAIPSVPLVSITESVNESHE